MKIKLLTLIALFLQFQTNAQLSISLDAGYAHHLAPYTGKNSDRVGEWETAYETVVYSFGRGLNYYGAIEYFPEGKMLGFGLGVGYLKSSEVQFLDNHDYDTQYIHTKNASMIRFSPFVKLKVDKERVQYYTKFGYVLGAFGNVTSENSEISEIYNEFYSRNVHNKGLAHGMMGGFGLNYKISDRLHLMGEVRMIAQSYAPTRGELVASTKNGEDRLPNLETVSIHVEFVDEHVVNWGPNNTTNDDNPSQSTKIYYPFSSVGVNVENQQRALIGD